MEVVPKSTLSEAMNRRDPEIFKALFEEILDRALKCAPSHKFRFQESMFRKTTWLNITSLVLNLLLIAYMFYLLKTKNKTDTLQKI